MPNMNSQTTQETVDQIEQIARNFSWQKLAMTVALFVACFVIIKIAITFADRTMSRTRLDRGVQKFLCSGLKVILWMVAVCVILGYLDVPMNSLVAIVSVLSLAVSLAVQGLLTNLAGGIMLLSAHPFTVDDWVEAGGVSGTVREIGLVYTKLTTRDNKVVYVPNGDISTKTIVNYSSEETRQVELKFSTSYDARPGDVKGCILKVIGEHPLTYATPEPMVRVLSYGDNAIEYVVRCWCANADYWTVYFDLNEQVKEEFDKAGIEMTYPHLNVHMMEK